MKECNETITIYNRRYDSDFGYDIWIPTVIKGVSWYKNTNTSITNDGLKSGTNCVIRIPIEADFSGKTYLSPLDFKASGAENVFSLSAGDIVIRGNDTGYNNPAEIKKHYPDMVTILGVTDSTKRPRGSHFRVVCA